MARDELPVLQGHPENDRFGRQRHALRLPDFLKRQVGKGDAVRVVKSMLRGKGLNTVCEEARCPNLSECFARKTATFMIMGRDCTRACGFCAVGTAVPAPLDANEPVAVAEAVASLELKHVVITSVNRDELPDGGAAHFASTTQAVRARMPNANIEVLTPDFCGDLDCVATVARAEVDVFNHNVETVPRLYSRVRPKARYQWSLDVLEHAGLVVDGIVVKSGIMVGLGEKPAEVVSVMKDLRAIGVQIVTIGQYLRPSLTHVPVVEYLREEAYAYYRDVGRDLGFAHVFAGPFVRSSYNADEALRHALEQS